MEPPADMRPSRARALLERLLRQAVRVRLEPLLELRGRSRNLDGGLTRGDHRLDAVKQKLEDLSRQVPKTRFTSKMTMDQAWRHHSDAPTIFSRYHLPACDSCAVRFDETLGEAARAYDLDLETLLSELNALLEGP